MAGPTVIDHAIAVGGYPAAIDPTRTFVTINTVGATFIFVAYTADALQGDVDPISDSMSNTWNRLPGYPPGTGTEHNTGGAGTASFYWVANPLTSATHTIQFTCISGAGKACIEASAWSGVYGSAFSGQIWNAGPSPFGQTYTTSGLAIAACCLAFGDGTTGTAVVTPGEGWTTLDSHAYLNALPNSYSGMTVCYQLLGSPTTVTAQFTWGGAVLNAGVLISGFTYTGPPPPPEPTTVAIRRLRRVPLPFAQNQQIFLGRLEILMQMGMGTTTSVDPQVIVRLSKDGGFTWGPERTLAVGKMGEYLRRCYSVQFGQGRQWVLEVSMTDPVASYWLDAFVDVVPGTA